MLIKAEKDKIRMALRHKRRTLSATDRLKKQQAILALLTALPVYRQAKSIACYWATQEEVPTDQLIYQIWQDGKLAYLPVIQDHNHMAFYSYQHNDSLKRNKFNIAEPITEQRQPVAKTQLDMIVVPLVAFDSCGNRLGMGRGYYDRYLQDTSAVTLGFAYDLQYLDYLPAEPWDVRLDCVVTESQVYTLRE